MYKGTIPKLIDKVSKWMCTRLTCFSSEKRPSTVETLGSAMAQHTLGWMIMPESKSVLIVDDDPSMLAGMKRLLREHGFNVTLFDSGAALLSHADFDDAFCIVLDIDLNDRSGIELRRQLADRGFKIPVIFITGNDSDTNRSAAIESGCIAYLTKPFSAKSLIEPIKKARAAFC